MLRFNDLLGALRLEQAVSISQFYDFSRKDSLEGERVDPFEQIVDEQTGHIRYVRRDSQGYEK